MKAACKIPCTIVTGFLGAGKSSLIDHFVSESESGAVAVLSYASIPEIRNFSGRTTALEGLNSTQAYGGLANIEDIAATLKKLLAQDAPPRKIAIEIGGLETPYRILELLARPEFAEWIVADGIIAVVDGYALSCSEFGGRRDAFRHRNSSPRSFAANPLAEIFWAQLLYADVVLLNKIDLITTRDRADIINRVRDFTRHAKILETCGCRLPDSISWLNLIATSTSSPCVRDWRGAPLPPPPASDFFGVAVQLPLFVSDFQLLRRLADLTQKYDALRMKGFAYAASFPRPFAVEGVGRRVRLEPAIGAASPDRRFGFLTIVSERKLAAQVIRHELLRNVDDIEDEFSDEAFSPPYAHAQTRSRQFRAPEEIS